MLKIAAQLVEVACGRRPADLYIDNGRVLNVYSGELLTGFGVAVSAGHIAYVGPARGMIGPDTQVMNAADGILVPGYVDPHAHFDLIVSLRALAEAVLPLGTTTIINDTLAISSRFGKAGLEYLLKAAEQLPLHVYFTVTPTGTAPELEAMGYPAGQQFTDEELEAALCDERVLGTGEMPPWRNLLTGNRQLLARLELAKNRGKLRSGHNPGARADQIQALAAAGITDCHEALTAEEALDRLRAGMYVILRHGPVRSDLPALAPLVRRKGVDCSRLMLTPDWVPPGDLANTGHLNQVITTALELGLPAVEVYRMATLNPARYMGLERQVGAIAPGRQADLLCLNSLNEPRPRWVISSGQWIAKDGQLLNGFLPEAAAHMLPAYLPAEKEVSVSDFQISCDRQKSAMVPAIELVNQTVTRRRDLQLPVKYGRIVLPEHNRQTLKIAMPKPEGGFAVGFLVGFDAPLGGLATSVASCPYHTLVIGANDQDMAQAYNRMVTLGGGIVAVHRGELAVELPLPVGGFISNAPIPEVASCIEQLNRWAKDLGSRFDNLFLVQRYFTYIGVPFFRMTPWGIYDVKEHCFLPSLLQTNS